MKVLILTAEGYEDSELLAPMYRFKEAGYDVDVAGPEKGQIKGKHGYSVEAGLTFAQAAKGKYDALFLPGGQGPEKVRQSKDATAITKTMLESGKPVGAICHAAQILISAGVARNRKATCWWGVADDLKAAGAKYEDTEVVVDGNLVTSRCPDDIPAFNREFMKLIENR